jgi:hypothetical protein
MCRLRRDQHLLNLPDVDDRGKRALQARLEARIGREGAVRGQIDRITGGLPGGVCTIQNETLNRVAGGQTIWGVAEAAAGLLRSAADAM